MKPRTADIRTRIDARLDELVPAAGEAVVRSMRHTLLAPGKRLRPLMTILGAAAFGGREDLAMDPACAIEMIHAASLILDDLPSMDDANLRRGLPANHVEFGEDVATLAAFALLNRAYAVVAGADGLSSTVRTKVIRTLTAAVGEEGIIAGQMADLTSCRHTTDLAEVQLIHRRKTGSLFVAAVECGALVVGVREEQLDPVRAFGTNFGLSFQALDDLADRLGTSASQGKDVAKDAHKATLVTSLGTEQARRTVERFATAAANALEPIGGAGEPLADLAHALLDAARRPAAYH